MTVISSRRNTWAMIRPPAGRGWSVNGRETHNDTALGKRAVCLSHRRLAWSVTVYSGGQ